MKFFNIFNLQNRHPFHLVDPSPWPFFVSLASLSLTTSGVLYFHLYSHGGTYILISLIALVLTMSFWLKDVIVEGTYEGHHTSYVQRGFRYGMLLFILSEVMFFFAFFWGFFHSSIAPSVFIGYVWPPKGILTLDPTSVALFNTMVLLLSGATVTWAHHAMQSDSREGAIMGLFFTVFLGILFTASQGFEYVSSTFQINDGIYGSVFYMMTGFHGFHVLVGTIMLTVCLVRQINYQFSLTHHVGLEAASWYWHFVDVVWLGLYVLVYIA